MKRKKSPSPKSQCFHPLNNPDWILKCPSLTKADSPGQVMPSLSSSHMKMLGHLNIELMLFDSDKKENSPLMTSDSLNLFLDGFFQGWLVLKCPLLFVKISDKSWEYRGLGQTVFSPWKYQVTAWLWTEPAEPLLAVHRCGCRQVSWWSEKIASGL